MTIQDTGRLGYGRFGVPRSGAFDRESLFLANTLLGNEPWAPALEISWAGASLRNEGAETTLSLLGAPCQVEIDGGRIPGQSRFTVPAGAVLTISQCKAARVYLAVPGGINVDNVLGSASGIVVSENTEGIYGRAENFEFSPAELRAMRLEQPPSSLANRPIRFLRGPQANFFDLSAFQATAFEVSSKCDRRGLRLHGICPGNAAEMDSRPAVPGVIQVTPSGEPILLGPDGPTVGGYPVVGVVICADLDCVGQRLPGESISFREVTEAEAGEAWQELEQRLSAVRKRLLLFASDL